VYWNVHYGPGIVKKCHKTLSLHGGDSDNSVGGFVIDPANPTNNVMEGFDRSGFSEQLNLARQWSMTNVKFLFECENKRYIVS